MTPFNPWSDLEARGLILPSPGRTEAVEASLLHQEQKRATAEAEHQAKLGKKKPKATTARKLRR